MPSWRSAMSGLQSRLIAKPSVQKAANFGRDKALEVEAAGFVKLAKTPVAASLIGLFLLKDQSEP